MAENESGVPLSRVIADLRTELARAMAAGKGQALRFRLKPVELELELGVTRSAGGQGGVKFWVFELGGKAERAEVGKHKIKLVLEPIDALGAGEVVVAQPGDTRAAAAADAGQDPRG